MGNSAAPFNRRKNDKKSTVLLPSIDKNTKKRITGKGFGSVNNDPLSQTDPNIHFTPGRIRKGGR
jgi:hypothetical protein